MPRVSKNFDEENSMNASKDRFNRIKFKPTVNKTQLTSDDRVFSRLKMGSVDSNSNFFVRFGDDRPEDLLDPGNCYHRDCCFAYNIMEDSRNAELIVECLPQPLYEKLAYIWDMDPELLPRTSGNTCKYGEEQQREENRMVDDYIKNVERDLGIQSEKSEDLQVDKGSADNLDEPSSHKQTIRKGNPYRKFLKKLDTLDSRQKKGPNLGKKAGKITEMIIGNFLKWYQSLGGNDEETFIERSTLHELFDVGFDMPAAKPMAVRIREMPTVPECLAHMTNEPKHATRYGLRQFLKQDIKMESIPTKMFAFGSMLPKEKSLRYKPPKNFVRKTWMECSRVPKDLDTMKTVWVGLEKLRSTIAFSNWLKNHPDITPPAYLRDKGLLNINYDEWNQMYKGFEVDVSSVDYASSDIKLQQEKSFIKEPKGSSSTTVKFYASSESIV